MKWTPLLALLLSCGSPALQADLFVVDFVNAPQPVMLSPEPTCAGRSVQARSGIYTEHSKNYSEKRWNVMGASEQLTSQVAASDRCVQIREVAFRAKIEWAYIWAKLDRELTIDGSVAP